MVETLTGTNRSAGLSVQELMAYDTHPVPEYLSRESPMPPGPTLVPAKRYYSPDFHEREMEQLWKHVWQMACHEDDLPGVGDYVPYEIGELSFLIVRSAPDEFKAFRNACLHRGRRLKERPGKQVHEIRCPFHSWAWRLDGSLKEIPCQWDFPYIDPAEQDLPEVPLGRWGRFIFINPDPNAEPFEEFLDDFPSNFELLPYEKRHKVAEVRKILRCNWKVAQDAFAESWHVFSTHPQVVWGFRRLQRPVRRLQELLAPAQSLRRPQPPPRGHRVDTPAALHRRRPPRASRLHRRHLRAPPRRQRRRHYAERHPRRLHAGGRLGRRRARPRQPPPLPVGGRSPGL